MEGKPRFYQFDDVRVNLEKFEVIKAESRARLEPKAFEALVFLIEHRGRLVEKKELLDAVWKDAFVTENAMTRVIAQLRKALGDDSKDAKYIETVPTRGYRFIAEVKKQERPGSNELEAAGLEQADRKAGLSRATLSGEPASLDVSSISKAVRAAFAFRRAWVLVGSLVLLLSVTTLLYFSFSRSPKPPADRAAPRSIAVLPFKPLVASERDQVYELGLANSLIITFSSIKELSVRPIEAMRKYIDLDLDPVAAGRELGVDFVLSSHYQISGGQIRVTSQLINVNDSSTFETFKCDEKCTDIFETQDAISLKVGQQLLAKLTDEQRRLLTKRYTENKEAYDLYLKGWNSWNKVTEESLKEGVNYFDQALAKDPKYALAYHGLTACHLVLGILYLDPREEMPKAKAAATKASEIDDSIAETHISLGGVAFFYDWDWDAAEREFKRAIELDPSLVRAHHWYGDYLSAMERHDEAIAEMTRAEELSGLFTSSNVARVLACAGRYDEAIEQCNRYPSRIVGETDFVLGHCYWEKGLKELAIEELIKANTFSGAMPRTVGPLGYLYAMSGKKDEAKKLLEELQQRSKQRYVSSYAIAQIYAGLGENDQVFAYLNKAFEEHANALVFVKVDPLLDPLRSDPRLADLLRRIGLAP